ncbi:MAG: FAD-dependent oxidoreductase [Candidatus Delongbacteria bacterium]|nr:FAD-dependent oxidoreductase [Candidatus Delongbacteria bacterium]MBN2833689.1 FAD-dependent oxidoreductase [Candidatus Delongbacteria bacterium]
MRTDILVIGGSASGIVASGTAKSNYPDKKVTLVRKEEKVMVPCGIPYIFGTLGASEKNIVNDKPLLDAGVEIIINEVVSIDKNDKTAQLKTGETICFEKLVLATGSTPTVPKWLKGSDKENVFVIPKDKVYLDELFVKIKQCKKVVTIGGGFIGVEISDELNKLGIETTIVEILPHVLNLAFDDEISSKAEDILVNRGVRLKTGVGVTEVLGDKKTSGVLLDNGEILEADAVILSVGYAPNSKLAEEAGIELNKKGYIIVDEYMRSEVKDIFAVGDCAEKRDYFTRKLSNLMLASTATSEARIAGMNLYNLYAVKTFGGSIAIFSTAIGDTGFGAAGLIESTAKKEGYDVVCGTFEGIDKHPGTLPNTNKQLVKLIVAKESGAILGGEVVGGESTGELINIIGIAIQNKLSINSILTAQIGSHPLLTAPPTTYPLIKAAEVVAKQIKSHFRK